MDAEDLAIIILTSIYVGQMLLNRRIVRRLLGRVMQTPSAHGSTTAHPPSWTPRPGVAAKSTLDIDLISRRPLPQDAAALFEELARQAKRRFRWTTVLELAVLVAYVYLLTDTAKESEQDSVSWGIAVALLLIPVTLVRYFLYRNQHKVLGAEHPQGLTIYANIAYVVCSPRWQALLRCGLAVLAATEAWPVAMQIPGVGSPWLKSEDAWGVLILATLHLLVEGGWFWYVQSKPGKGLLILRVFGGGDEEAEEVLFKSVQKTWGQYGHSYTILDIELLKRRTSLFTVGMLMMSMFAFWLPMLAVVTQGDVQGFKLENALGLLPVMAGLLAVDFLWVYRHVFFSQVKSEQGLRRLLKRRTRWPRDLDGRFAKLEAACFDNTWRPTVEAFAARSQVVLMNLANYTPQRSGCAEEVNWLFDHVPLDRVIFMARAAELDSITQQLMQPCWQELRAESPNLNLAAPQAQVFVLDDHPAQESAEQLLAWIQSIAATPVASDVSAVPAAKTAFAPSP